MRTDGEHQEYSNTRFNLHDLHLLEEALAKLDNGKKWKVITRCS